MKFTAGAYKVLALLTIVPYVFQNQQMYLIEGLLKKNLDFDRTLKYTLKSDPFCTL